MTWLSSETPAGGAKCLVMFIIAVLLVMHLRRHIINDKEAIIFLYFSYISAIFLTRFLLIFFT